MPADGSGQPQLIASTDTASQPSSISPDGATLLYTENGPAGRTRVMLLPLSANAPREAHPLREVAADDSQGMVSPDGKWIALTSTETGSREVYLMQLAGGAKVRVSADGGLSPLWADNGRELLYWTTNVGPARLMSVAVTAGAPITLGVPRELFASLAPGVWGVAPDGRILLETVPDIATSTMVIITNWFEELRRRTEIKR